MIHRVFDRNEDGSTLRMDSNRRTFRRYNMEHGRSNILVLSREIMAFQFRRACRTGQCFTRASGLSRKVAAIQRGIVCSYLSSGTCFNKTLCVNFNGRLSVFSDRLASIRVFYSCSISKNEMIVISNSRLSKQECIKAGDERRVYLVTWNFMIY